MPARLASDLAACNILERMFRFEQPHNLNLYPVAFESWHRGVVMVQG